MAMSIGGQALLPPLVTDDAGRRPRAAWRWLRRLLVALLVLAAVAVLRVTYFRAEPVPVTVVPVERGPVEEIVANNKAGSVAARRRATFGPAVGGPVVEVLVREGARVARGTPLLRLDPATARHELEMREQAARTAAANTEQTCAAALLAGREVGRVDMLRQDGLVSLQAIDLAQNRHETAVAACEASLAAEASARTAIRLARDALARTTLVAPFAGVVSRVDVERGEWLTPAPAGMVLPGVIELIDTSSIYVRAPLDETDVARVRVGLPVRITLDAFPGRSFPGKLTFVSPYVSDAQQQNRTFDVDAEFDDTGFARSLPPGTSADVEVILSRRDEAVRLPTSAILQGGRVLVVRDGVLVSVPVKTGLVNWEFSEIAGGVGPGEEVVVSLDRVEVREGARVRVEPAAAR